MQWILKEQAVGYLSQVSALGSGVIQLIYIINTCDLIRNLV